MAVQAALKRFVSGCYEKFVVPGLYVASRNSHISANNLCSPHHARNVILSLQSPFTGKVEMPNFFKEPNSCLSVPVEHGKFLDLDLLNSVNKSIYMPSTSLNKVKIYEEKHHGLLQTVMDPLLRDCEIVHIPVPGQTLKREAHTMINIRRRKMKKHQRRKLYKKMKFAWEKLWRKKEVKKETAFRLELLTQIDEAKSLDAEKYVQGVVDRIRYHKKPPTAAERWEQYRLLIKKNRSNTIVVMPRFDED